MQYGKYRTDELEVKKIKEILWNFTDWKSVNEKYLERVLRRPDYKLIRLKELSTCFEVESIVRESNEPFEYRFSRAICSTDPKHMFKILGYT